MDTFLLAVVPLKTANNLPSALYVMLSSAAPAVPDTSIVTVHTTADASADSRLKIAIVDIMSSLIKYDLSLTGCRIDTVAYYSIDR